MKPKRRHCRRSPYCLRKCSLAVSQAFIQSSSHPTIQSCSLVADGFEGGAEDAVDEFGVGRLSGRIARSLRLQARIDGRRKQHATQSRYSRRRDALLKVCRHGSRESTSTARRSCAMKPPPPLNAAPLDPNASMIEAIILLVGEWETGRAATVRERPRSSRQVRV